MIVLAISGVLLSAAILMFRGQQGRTEFSQSMRDIDSKIQVIAKNVASGISSGAESNNCAISGTPGRPTLSSGSTSGIGSNTDCIFLGDAVKVTQGSDTINIYTVLGKRDASSFSEAMPTVVGASEDYTLIGGTTVKSSLVSDFSTDTSSNKKSSNLVGIYLGMNSGSWCDSGSAGGSLLMRSYDPSVGDAASFVAGQTGCSDTTQVSQWGICFQSAYNSNTTASLMILPSSSGVTTQLNFDGC